VNRVYQIQPSTKIYRLSATSDSKRSADPRVPLSAKLCLLRQNFFRFKPQAYMATTTSLTVCRIHLTIPYNVLALLLWVLNRTEPWVLGSSWNQESKSMPSSSWFDFLTRLTSPGSWQSAPLTKTIKISVCLVADEQTGLFNGLGRVVAIVVSPRQGERILCQPLLLPAYEYSLGCAFFFESAHWLAFNVLSCNYSNLRRTATCHTRLLLLVRHRQAFFSDYLFRARRNHASAYLRSPTYRPRTIL